MRTTTLKPGLLVSCKTKITGGVEKRAGSVDAADVAAAQASASAGSEIVAKASIKIVKDKEEYKCAKVARSKCQSLIRGACIKSEFGLLCPDAREDNLQSKLDEAQEEATSFNRSTTTDIRIDVYVIAARIAPDDDKAARALASEMRGLLDSMQTGITAGDVDVIRDAARRARSLGTMLDEESAGRVQRSILEAREIAKAIVKRVQDGGERLDVVIGEFKRSAIEQARFAFLDMDAPERQAGASLPAVTPRGLDLDAAAAGEAPPPASPQAQRDVEF
jgi:hypothetical protein